MSRKELLSALLDQPHYDLLYQENPTFHAELDLMVSMLPTWVAGLATGAMSQESVKIEEIQRLVYGEPAEGASLLIRQMQVPSSRPGDYLPEAVEQPAPEPEPDGEWVVATRPKRTRASATKAKPKPAKRATKRARR